MASNGQGPPSITDRLRSTADGAQAAADLIRAGAAGLAAAQAFRSQLPQDAADYVRLNVLPRPGPAQPPPQMIGPVTWSASWTRRGSARRRWSVARRRPLRRRLPLRAWAEAERLGTWKAWLKEQQPWRPPRARLLERCRGGSWRGGAGRWACSAAYGLARGTGWVLENTLFRPQQGSEDAAVQDVRSANGMNDATQPQHFTLRTGSSTSGSPANSCASSQSGFRVQAQSNNTPRPFSWGLNPVALVLHGY